MFDGIGRQTDPEASRRSAASVGLTTLLLAAALGFQMGVAALYVSEIVAPEPDDTELVMLAEPVEAPVADLAPAPPPPAKGVAAEPRPEPQPTEPTEHVPELPTEVPEALTPKLEPAGTADGDPNGHADGVPGGKIGGTPGGTGTADGSGGRVVAFHQSELVRIRPVDPEYPRAAQQLNLGKVSCLVSIVIDERGVPVEVDIEGCPTVFHPATRDAMMRSRWAPAKVDGRKVRASTKLRITYVPR